MANQCAGMTWDAGTQQLFDKCSDGLAASLSADNRSLKREAIKNRLGDAILKDQVPDVNGTVGIV
jgi:hypothetical protein